MVVECSSLKETQNLKDYKIHLPVSRGIFSLVFGSGTLFLPCRLCGENQTERLSGLIEDNSFKRLVAYEDDLWRTPGATDNVFFSRSRDVLTHSD